MKRIQKIITLVLACLLLVSLAACGSGPNPGAATEKGGTSAVQEQSSAQTGESTVKKDVVNLKFMIVAGNDEMPAWKGITDSFNKNNQDVQVKLEQLPGSWNEYNQKVTALIAAGTPPDIGRMGVSMMPQYVSKGQVEELTDYINKDINMADYYENAFKQCAINGKTYGLPIGIYTMALYYNKAMFDAAGVKYPGTDWSNPWTVDEFRDAAKKLTKGEGPAKQYGYLAQLHPERTGSFVYGNGGNFLNDSATECTMNSEPVKAAYKLLQDMIYVDKTSPTPAQLMTMPLDQMFTSDKLAMFIEGAWMMPAVSKNENFKFGVAPVPKGLTNCTTVNFLDQYILFKGSQHIPEAWRVIKSFIEKDAENIMVDNKIGGIPVLKSVADSRKADMFNPLTPEEKDVWFKSVDKSQAMIFTPNWSELMDKAMKTIDLVGLNQMPADQAMDKVKSDLDQLLKK